MVFIFRKTMNELDSLRQEAETLKNAIRVSIRNGFGNVHNIENKNK